MFRDFRQIYTGWQVRSDGSPSNNATPFSVFTRNGIKTLVSLALTLMVLGILTLIFPMVLAVVVAALFFVIALVCLSFAWKLYRVSRGVSRTEPEVRVEIHRSGEDFQ